MGLRTRLGHCIYKKKEGNSFLSAGNQALVPRSIQAVGWSLRRHWCLDFAVIKFGKYMPAGWDTQCYSAVSCVNWFRIGSSQKVSLHYQTASSDLNVRFIYRVFHLKPARLNGVSADSGPVLSGTFCITIKLCPHGVIFTNKNDQFHTQDMLFLTEEVVLVDSEVRTEAFYIIYRGADKSLAPAYFPMYFVWWWEFFVWC